jgi:hypothetical protein
MRVVVVVEQLLPAGLWAVVTQYIGAAAPPELDYI